MSALAAPAPQPRLWLVVGDKRGDNGQVEVLARALEARLGWTGERRQLWMRPPWDVKKPKVVPSLHHLDAARSDPLAAPWPDLVVTIGRRPSMAALWIREQSGGRTRIVLLGKPSGPAEEYDLIIVGGEAQMPELPNLMTIELPLMEVDAADVTAAGQEWRARLDALPRPLVAICLGGPTGPMRYGAALVERVVELCGSITAQGGTPYVTTSRRTPKGFVRSLENRLPAAALSFIWRPDALDNPYRGLLAHADGIVVSGDSISMMVEVARLGRPLAILSVPTGPFGWIDEGRRSLCRWAFDEPEDDSDPVLKRFVARVAMRLGLVGQTRDFRHFHETLVARGFAVWAGEPFRPTGGRATADLDRIVDRVEAIMRGNTPPPQASTGRGAIAR